MQGRIQERSNGGVDEKSQAKEGVDRTKMRTFRRKFLEKSEKSNPKEDVTAPTTAPPPPTLDLPLRECSAASQARHSLAHITKVFRYYLHLEHRIK